MKQTYKHDSHAGHSSRQARRPKKRSGWMDLLLFYLIPFFVGNGILFILVAARPHITIQVADTRDYQTTTAMVTVKSLLPIKEFTSTQEDAPLELTETKKGHYTVQITQNGVIEIYAKALNGMTDMQYEHVNILDDVAPSVSDQYSIRDGILTLTLEDSQSGLNCQSVYAVTASGLTISPTTVDKQTGTFTFEMSEESLMIYASDLAGNPMQATFSTHTEMLNPDGTPAAFADPADPGMEGTEMAEGSLSSDESTEEETKAEAGQTSERTETESAAAAAKTTEATTTANTTEAAETAKTTEAAPVKTTEAPFESSGGSGEVSIYIDTTTP